jgi:tRNA-splicing ligase RtcB
MFRFTLHASRFSSASRFTHHAFLPLHASRITLHVFFPIFVSNMKIQGKYNTAVIFNDNVDTESYSQILDFCNQEIFRDALIRIMPDVHAGKGCVIGYTANLTDKVIPNLIGLDIGCGILCTNLGKFSPSFDRLDKFIIKNIPYGFERNKSVRKDDFETEFTQELEEACDQLEIKFSEHLKGVGSLGGGNHFIEVAEDSKKNKWLLIHSGSRNFGLQVATWHQDKAISINNKKGTGIAKHFAYLDGKEREDYIRHMKLAQWYARLNRKEMTRRILEFFGTREFAEQFESVHNYINFDDKIIRKGAISAHEGEKMIIPLNMRDGSLIATGKGNREWNYSAPHGAGRRLSRNQAKKQIDLAEFRKSMKNVWTSTVSEKTKDEAPQAYKPKGEILQYIPDSVEVVDNLKPLYNFKAE